MVSTYMLLNAHSGRFYFNYQMSYLMMYCNQYTMYELAFLFQLLNCLLCNVSIHRLCVLMAQHVFYCMTCPLVGYVMQMGRTQVPISLLTSSHSVKCIRKLSISTEVGLLFILVFDQLHNAQLTLITFLMLSKQPDYYRYSSI